MLDEVSNAILLPGTIARPTLQQPRHPLRNIFQHDLPPSVLDQTIDWRLLFISFDGCANFHHAARPFLQEIDRISCDILEQKPGSKCN